MKLICLILILLASGCTHTPVKREVYPIEAMIGKWSDGSDYDCQNNWFRYSLSNDRKKHLTTWGGLVLLQVPSYLK